MEREKGQHPTLFTYQESQVWLGDENLERFSKLVLDVTMLPPRNWCWLLIRKDIQEDTKNF